MFRLLRLSLILSISVQWAQTHLANLATEAIFFTLLEVQPIGQRSG